MERGAQAGASRAGGALRAELVSVWLDMPVENGTSERSRESIIDIQKCTMKIKETKKKKTIFPLVALYIHLD